MKNLLNKAFPTSVFVLNYEKNQIEGSEQEIKVCFINEKCKNMFTICSESELLQKMDQIICVDETKHYVQQLSQKFTNQKIQQKGQQKYKQRPSIENQESFFKKPMEQSKILNSKMVVSDQIIQKKRMNVSQNLLQENNNNASVNINQSEQIISLKSQRNEDSQQLTLLKVIQQKIHNYFSRSLMKNSFNFHNSDSFFIPKDNMFIKCMKNINEESSYYNIDLVECQWQDKKSIMFVMNDVTYQVNNLRLKALDNYKDGLLFSVAHDLRNPISSIQLFLDLALNCQDEKEQQNYIKKSIKICNLALSMIKDLVDLSQINKGKLRLNFSNFNLQNAVNEVYDILGFQAETKHIELRYNCDIPNEQLDITNDQNRLKQILINLIGNAIKFTFNGYIATSISLDQKYIDCFRISVEDTGVGIPKHIQKRLFQPFATFEHSGANNKHGVGLGLTICKSLAKYIGPKSQNIILITEEQVGSSFSFLVSKNNQLEASQFGEVVSCQNVSELVQNQNKSLRQLKFKEMKNLNKYEMFIIKENKFQNQIKALIVDDISFNIIIIKKLLERQSFYVYEAYNGQDALDILQQHRDIQLIILDLNMPIMDGLETLKKIKQMQLQGIHNNQLKIFMITGQSSSEEKDQCLKQGAHEYLVKGFKSDEFDRIIKKHFQLN